MNLETLIILPFKEIMDMVMGFVPTFVVGFFVLTLGYMFSKLVKDVVHGLLKTIRLDDIFGKLGLKEVLGNGGIKHKFSEILSLIVYYILLLTTLLVTLKTFGLESVSPLLERVLAYIPSVINGVVVLILGMYLAKFVSGLVYVVAKNTDMPAPETMSHLSKYAVLIYAGLIFVEEIGLGSLLVGTTFHILFGAVCFALALAYGLGGKDMAAKYLEETKKKGL